MKKLAALGMAALVWFGTIRALGTSNDCPAELETMGLPVLKEALRLRNYHDRAYLVSRYASDRGGITLVHHQYVEDYLFWVSQRFEQGYTEEAYTAYASYMKNTPYAAARRQAAQEFQDWTLRRVRKASASHAKPIFIPVKKKKPLANPSSPKPPSPQVAPVELSPELQDLVIYRWLYRMPTSKTVGLLIGNPLSLPTAHQQKSVREFVISLVAQGYRVLYDADSQLASTIAESAGEAALGLSAHPSEKSYEGRVLTIKNPYVRMKAFSHKVCEKIVVSPDSLTGVGALFQQNVDLIWDIEGRWKEGTSRWLAHIRDKHRESKQRSTVEVHHDPETLLSQMKSWFSFLSFGAKEKYKFPPFDVQTTYEESAHHYLGSTKREMEKQAQSLIEGRKAITDASLGSLGATFFGSSEATKEWGDLIYRLFYFLGENGIPVVTGGAGGLMATANAGAFNAGAPSIGIPVNGVFLLKERKTERQFHTLTFEAEGYEARIPLLLGDRPLILIGPGSSGTMKELACTLFHLAGKTGFVPYVVFVGSSFYGDIVRGLKDALPPPLPHRLYLVDSPDEMAKVVAGLRAELGEAQSRLGSFVKPTPRHKN